MNFIRENFPERFDKIRFGTLEKTNEFLAAENLSPAKEIEVSVGLKVAFKNRLAETDDSCIIMQLSITENP